MFIMMLGLVMLWLVDVMYDTKRSIEEVKGVVLRLGLVMFLMSIMCLVWYDGLLLMLVNYKDLEEVLCMILNSGWSCGFDGLSLYFIILSTLLIVVGMLCGWESVSYSVSEYMLLMILTDIMLMGFFCVRDVLGFYILFESLLIPMYLLMGVWGSSGSSVHAAYQFFLYTLCGSMVMLMGMVLLYKEVGGTDMIGLESLENGSLEVSKLMWLSFFAGLSVKMPMVPFHLWLPEAHVEAPTGGSVLLAGMLLKMGGYGFMSLSLPLGRIVNDYFMLFVFVVSIVGIVYTSLVTVSQVDLKSMIAYASVGHMNYVTLGIFSNNVQGLVGSVFLMLSHGFVSSGLFMCMGVIYDSYKSSLLMNYGGLVYIMPMYCIMMFIFMIANMGFPGTSSFMGELLVLVGLVKLQFVVVFLSGLSLVLGAIYSMWFFNSLVFGSMGSYESYCDVNKSEFFLLGLLCVMIVMLGIRPGMLLSGIEYNISSFIL